MKINHQYIMYIIFAICSTVLNFLVQKFCEVIFYSINKSFFSLLIYKSIDIATLLKLATATIAAFVFKYSVDRFLVFKKEKYATKQKEITGI